MLAMPETDSVKKRQPILLLDPDKFGLACATFFGTLVMGFGFYQEMDILEAAIRAGVTFLVVYLGTFVLVSVVRRVVSSELRRIEQQRAEAQGPAAEAKESDESRPARGGVQ